MKIRSFLSSSKEKNTLELIILEEVEGKLIDIQANALDDEIQELVKRKIMRNEMRKTQNIDHLRYYF